MLLFNKAQLNVYDNRKGGVCLRIRELREQKGLSQVQLAELSHVHRVSISMYETGRKKPNIDSLKRLAKALDVSTDDLLGESA